MSAIRSQLDTWSVGLAGMTLRQWYAGQALPSVITARVATGVTKESIAAECYELADAMLAQDKRPTSQH